MKREFASRVSSLALSIALFSSGASAGMDDATKTALSASMNGEHRSAEDKARDQYRKPKQVLEFLGFKSDMTVVEIWPGGGWYSKILAPALQKHGKYYAATTGLNPPYGYQRRGLSAMLSTFGETPDLFRDAVITEFLEPYSLDIAPKGSADMILTFRNVHNLFADGYGEGRYVDLVFQVMHDTLKPGCVLGIVDHRWPDPATEDPKAVNGYLSVERTVKHAEAAGFKLADQSDLLANKKDTRNHPEGVWTLPPSLALGDKDKDKYLAIGESDRFLLKFVKPAE
ncbi:MAG: methyltransferase [Pseudomonadota bacterium]